MKLLTLILPLLLGCISVPRPTETVQPEYVLEDAMQDVVALVKPTGFVYCSGVIVEGLVVTSAHCLDDGEVTEARVAFRGILDVPVGSVDVQLVGLDTKTDLAILQGITKEFQIGRLLAPGSPVMGERVVAVGHPLGLTWSVTEGIVVNPRRCLWSTWVSCMMQMSLPLAPGNSGGAIYNKYGEVVGIASFHMRGYEHLTGATAWQDIKNLVEEVKNNE